MKSRLFSAKIIGIGTTLRAALSHWPEQRHDDAEKRLRHRDGCEMTTEHPAHTSGDPEHQAENEQHGIRQAQDRIGEVRAGDD